MQKLHEYYSGEPLQVMGKLMPEDEERNKINQCRQFVGFTNSETNIQSVSANLVYRFPENDEI